MTRTAYDQLVHALRAARRDGTGVVLCAVPPGEIARLIGWLARGGYERSRWNRDDRVRHFARLTREGPP